MKIKLWLGQLQKRSLKLDSLFLYQRTNY